MQVLVNSLSIAASIFAILSVVLTIWNKSLLNENKKLHNEINYLFQDNSKHFEQIVNIKKGETKRQYDTEHMIRKSYPIITLYVFLFSYLILGYIIGRSFNIIPRIISLFLPKIQFSNPDFWIVIFLMIIISLVPLYHRKRIIKKFPHKAMEVTLSSASSSNEKNDIE